MCISDFNLIRESTVFIGDEDKDIQAALNANIRGLMSPSNELEIFLQELLN
jgi:histidinol phosphatase-like enzyme